MQFAQMLDASVMTAFSSLATSVGKPLAETNSAPEENGLFESTCCADAARLDAPLPY